MGGSQGREAGLEDDEDFGFQDDVFPWFHLVQWCAEDSSSNRIFRWDLNAVQNAATALTTDVETFLASCPEPLPAHSGFTMGDDTNFAEWAGALLEWSSALRHVRFRLVPQRMSEERFWSRYFAGLQDEVCQTIFDDASSDDAEPTQQSVGLGDSERNVPTTAVVDPSSSAARAEAIQPEPAGKRVRSCLAWIRDGITAQEVAENNSRGSAWIIVKNRVYDPTGFLDEHPGGSSSILRTAGGDATEDFEVMHPESAWQVLEDFYLGPLRLAPAELPAQPVAVVSSLSQASTLDAEPTVLGSGVHQLRLEEKTVVSHDTRIFRFALPFPDAKLGLPVGMHMYVVARIDGKEVQRPYTPISDNDTLGHVDLLVKVYGSGMHPEFQAGGCMSQHLDSLRVGGAIDVKGPVGDFVYKGRGIFTYKGKKCTCNQMCFVAGGTGLTPCYQVASAILKDAGDNTKISLLYANRTPSDVLLRNRLEQMSEEYRNRFKVSLTVDRVPEGEADWNFATGLVDEAMLQEALPGAPGDGTLALLCGPPGMLEASASLLRKIGFGEHEIIFL